MCVAVVLACWLAVSGADAAADGGKVDDGNRGADIRYFAFAALSSRGQALAFAAAASEGVSPDGTLYIEVTKLLSGETQRLPGRFVVRFEVEPERPGAHLMAMPQWSPDGDRLAYLALDEDRPRLWIWDRTSDTSLPIPGVEACGLTPRNITAPCRDSALQWHANGAMIYFLGIRARSSTAPPDAQCPAPSGGDIYAYDVRSRELRPITNGARFSTFVVSPDGTTIVAAVRCQHPWKPEQSKQDYADYYAIHLDEVGLCATAERAGASAVDMQTCLPVLTSVPQRYPLFSWSPDSQHIALVERGPETDGDVILLNVRTRQARNLSARWTQFRMSEKERNRLAKNALFPGAKFGASLVAPVWVDPTTLLLPRRAVAADGQWRTALWTLRTTTARPRKIIDVPGCDVIAVQASGSGAVTVLYCSSGQARLLSLQAREQDIAGDVIFEGDRPSSIEFGEAGVAFVAETRAAPPEVYIYSPNESASRRLTFVNRDAACDPIVAQTIRWRTVRNELSYGLLLHQPGTDPLAAPLIVSTYPGPPYKQIGARQQCPNIDKDLPAPLAALLRRGYTIFLPDMTIAGGGSSCDELALDMALALEALRGQRAASVDRAGIIGFSFGGWAASCLVTRGTQFNAAVSVAGFSNFISGHFGDYGRIVPRGGGQTNIGIDIREDVRPYWNESPVARAADVRTPLLLVHGEDDRNVPVSQSREMFHALNDAGKQTELAIVRGANHQSIFAHEETIRRVIEWFGRWLPNAPGP